MNIFESIFNFITDKSRKISAKVFILFVLVLLALLANDLLGFTYHYNTSQRISNIKDLGSILNDSTLTRMERDHLLQLRHDIIEHQSYIEKGYTRLYNFFVPSKYAFEISSNKPSEPDLRNYVLHFVTASWPWLIILLVLPIVGFMDTKTSFWKTLVVLILIEPLIYVIALLFSKALYLIPVINGNPVYNYILNVLIYIPFIYFLYRRDKNRKTKKAAPKGTAL